MYVGLERAKELNNRQMVICRCVDWNEEGYQIAQWDKHDKQFWFSGQPNDDFHKCITAFAKLNEDGKIVSF